MLNQYDFVADCYRHYAENGIQPGNPDHGKWEKAHYPIPSCLGGTETIFLLWEDHQQQGILQSHEFNHRCFYPHQVKLWLNTCNVFPNNFFELWEIVEKFHGTDGSQMRTPGAILNLKESMSKFFNSERGIARKQEVAKFMSKTKRKPLEIYFSDGKIGRYPCQRFAAVALGIDYRRLNNWITGFRKPTEEFGILSIKLV